MINFHRLKIKLFEITILKKYILGIKESIKTQLSFDIDTNHLNAGPFFSSLNLGNLTWVWSSKN